MHAENHLSKSHDLLSDRVRLAIMATLASAAHPIGFKTLLLALELDNNDLSSQLSKLEAQQLARISNAFTGQQTLTTCACTSLGREAILNWLRVVESMLPAGSKH